MSEPFEKLAEECDADGEPWKGKLYREIATEIARIRENIQPTSPPKELLSERREPELPDDVNQL